MACAPSVPGTAAPDGGEAGVTLGGERPEESPERSG